ncbi:pyruvate ferredoxin oxidoreductase delta subunit [Thermanaeromonas toyohensis ToBE]|uniref:Pyruvate ferredoxin oxidoreductase delta subunit n=1 Tax=Thermanaeromonas toyohensis ToBE TaxID=698762 RepID=A0A1W1V9U3_9FIRM|nr:pyruvate ferredoxin oxidoreductase delta subunit [Thermanaeromonas toyohensis ToBE]
MALKNLPVVPSAPPGTMALKPVAATWRERYPRIIRERCNACGECLYFCPEGALRLKEHELEINLDFCKGCGICAHECKKDALHMVAEYTGPKGLLG